MQDDPEALHVGDEVEFSVMMNRGKETAAHVNRLEEGSIVAAEHALGTGQGEREEDARVRTGIVLQDVRNPSERRQHDRDRGGDRGAAFEPGVVQETGPDMPDGTGATYTFRFGDLANTRARITQGDEVSFRVVRNTLLGVDRAVDVTVSRTRAERETSEQLQKLLQDGAPRENGVIDVIKEDFGFIRCVSQTEDVYFRIDDVVMPAAKEAEAEGDRKENGDTSSQANEDAAAAEAASTEAGASAGAGNEGEGGKQGGGEAQDQEPEQEPEQEQKKQKPVYTVQVHDVRKTDREAAAAAQAAAQTAGATDKKQPLRFELGAEVEFYIIHSNSRRGNSDRAVDIHLLPRGTVKFEETIAPAELIRVDQLPSGGATTRRDRDNSGREQPGIGTALGFCSAATASSAAPSLQDLVQDASKEVAQDGEESGAAAASSDPALGLDYDSDSATLASASASAPASSGTGGDGEGDKKTTDDSAAVAQAKTTLRETDGRIELWGRCLPERLVQQMRTGDVLRADVVLYFAENILFTRSARMLKCSSMLREEGVVSSLKDTGFGFISCTDRDGDVYFRFDDVIGVRGEHVFEHPREVTNALRGNGIRVSFDLTMDGDVSTARTMQDLRLRATRVLLEPREADDAPDLRRGRRGNSSAKGSDAENLIIVATNVSATVNRFAIQRSEKRQAFQRQRRTARGVAVVAPPLPPGLQTELPPPAHIVALVRRFVRSSLRELLLPPFTTAVAHRAVHTLADKAGLGHETQSGKLRVVRVWKFDSREEFEKWRDTRDSSNASRRQRKRKDGTGAAAAAAGNGDASAEAGDNAGGVDGVDENGDGDMGDGEQAGDRESPPAADMGGVGEPESPVSSSTAEAGEGATALHRHALKERVSPQKPLQLSFDSTHLVEDPEDPVWQQQIEYRDDEDAAVALLPEQSKVTVDIAMDRVTGKFVARNVRIVERPEIVLDGTPTVAVVEKMLTDKRFGFLRTIPGDERLFFRLVPQCFARGVRPQALDKDTIVHCQIVDHLEGEMVVTSTARGGGAGRNASGQNLTRYAANIRRMASEDAQALLRQKDVLPCDDCVGVVVGVQKKPSRKKRSSPKEDEGDEDGEGDGEGEAVDTAAVTLEEGEQQESEEKQENGEREESDGNDAAAQAEEAQEDDAEAEATFTYSVTIVPLDVSHCPGLEHIYRAGADMCKMSTHESEESRSWKRPQATISASEGDAGAAANGETTTATAPAADSTPDAPTQAPAQLLEPMARPRIKVMSFADGFDPSTLTEGMRVLFAPVVRWARTRGVMAAAQCRACPSGTVYPTLSGTIARVGRSTNTGVVEILRPASTVSTAAASDADAKAAQSTESAESTDGESPVRTVRLGFDVRELGDSSGSSSGGSGRRRMALRARLSEPVKCMCVEECSLAVAVVSTATPSASGPGSASASSATGELDPSKRVRFNVALKKVTQTTTIIEARRPESADVVGFPEGWRALAARGAIPNVFGLVTTGAEQQQEAGAEPEAEAGAETGAETGAEGEMKEAKAEPEPEPETDPSADIAL